MKKQYIIVGFLLFVAFLIGYLFPKPSNNPTLKFSVSQYRQLSEYQQGLNEALPLTNKKEKLEKLMNSYYKLRDAKSGLRHLSLLFGNQISLDTIESRVGQMETHLKDYITMEASNLVKDSFNEVLMKDISIASNISKILNYEELENKDVVSVRNSIEEINKMIVNNQ